VKMLMQKGFAVRDCEAQRLLLGPTDPFQGTYPELNRKPLWMSDLG
jgi:hypothetical protein